jgi:hypothetical protein
MEPLFFLDQENAYNSVGRFYYTLNLPKQYDIIYDCVRPGTVEG